MFVIICQTVGTGLAIYLFSAGQRAFRSTSYSFPHADRQTGCLLSVCLSVIMSIKFVCPSEDVRQSVWQSISQFGSQSVCLPVCQSVSLSACLSVCLSVSLSVWQSISQSGNLSHQSRPWPSTGSSCSTPSHANFFITPTIWEPKSNENLNGTASDFSRIEWTSCSPFWFDIPTPPS